MKTIFVGFFAFLISANSNAIFGGTGSAGTGNGMEIGGDGLEAFGIAQIEMQGNKVIDLDKREVIFEVKPAVEVGIAAGLVNGEYVPSRLGSVDGFEWVPETGSNQAHIEWMVCPKVSRTGSSCLRLLPKSPTNPKTVAFIGSLRIK